MTYAPRPPPLDAALGLGAYSTTHEGRGGRIRSEPGDFVVREVLSAGAVRSIRKKGRYAVYVLRKEGIDTGHCIEHVYRWTRIRVKALGLKDAAARTEQFVCATAAGPGIREQYGRQYSLHRVGYVERPLTAKSMVGNRFDITVRGGRGLDGISLDHTLLNYYGYQRFGSRRPITHLVGRAIVRNDLNEVIRLMLTEPSQTDSDKSNHIRRMLADPARYSECLEMMPHHMDTERALVKSLVDDGDPNAAFREIPLYLRRLFVNAYQSYIFNRTLTAAFLAGHDVSAPQEGDVCFDDKDRLGRYGTSEGQRLAIPMVGYSYYKKTRFHDIISDILDAEDVSPGDFYIKSRQELSSEGGFRQAAVSCTDVDISTDRISFTLSRGSFATMVLREIIKPEDPLAAGF